MINIEVPAGLRNKHLRKILRIISLSVMNDSNPCGYTFAEDEQGMRLSANFDTVSHERYHIRLELTKEE